MKLLSVLSSVRASRYCLILAGVFCWTLLLLFIGLPSWSNRELRDHVETAVPVTTTRDLQGYSCSNESLSQAEQRKNIVYSVLELKTPHFLPGSLYKNPCWIDGQGESQEFMCVPYVFLAGFPKCASTDLYSRLLAHPLVSPANTKEPFFWSHRIFTYGVIECDHKEAIDSSTSCLIRRYASTFFSNAAKEIQLNQKLAEEGEAEKKGPISSPIVDTSEIIRYFWRNFSEEWTYHRQQEMQKIPFPMITVDGTTGYSWNETSWRMIFENQHLAEPVALNPDAIHKVNPQAKIIMIMRNPVTRAYSMYTCMKKNNSPEDFHNKVVTFMAKFENCTKVSSLSLCVYDTRGPMGVSEAYADLEPGLYHVHLREWLRRFPRENFLFLRTEDYNKNMSAVLEQMFDFLEIPRLSSKAMETLCKMNQKNSSAKKIERIGAMLATTREILTKFFAEHNRMLADLLGDDRYTWQDAADS